MHKNFDIGRHIIYVLKKQIITGVIILIIFALSSFAAILNSGINNGLQKTLISLTLLIVACLLCLGLFSIVYIPKLIYVFKAKKQHTVIVKALSIMAEYVKWYVLLLFVVEALNFSNASQISTYIVRWHRIVSLIFAFLIGYSYKE